MKIYSGLDKIKIGNASNKITEGTLCLEGGAFRGIYTAGVLDCLMESDINLRTAIGVSAGALNGMSYIAGNMGRNAYCDLKHRHNHRWIGKRNLLIIRMLYATGLRVSELVNIKLKDINIGDRTIIANSDNTIS